VSDGPLKGVTVTEFTSAWAGPYATCVLGFLGAEIIKVESKKRIDHSRFTSFTTGKAFSNPDESSVFNILNLNKLSVCLNLAAGCHHKVGFGLRGLERGETRYHLSFLVSLRPDGP
jgi:crotonobetainyl-CoA:carnitine CoA-transferase CaiB-like acyl-CoA transferase